jgi:hypothetical protein
MPPSLDPYQLLHGLYTPQPLRRGDRASCLFRDSDVVLTGWSDGRISWPLCRRPGQTGGRPGLLLDEELARAVRLAQPSEKPGKLGPGIHEWTQVPGCSQVLGFVPVGALTIAFPGIDTRKRSFSIVTILTRSKCHSSHRPYFRPQGTWRSSGPACGRRQRRTARHLVTDASREFDS